MVLAAIAALAGLHQIDTFRIVDGRFFDEVTTREAGQPAKVVIIEQDAAFGRLPSSRFAQLDSGLERLGAERIGYLGGREDGATNTPVVLAVTPQPIPASEGFAVEAPAGAPANAVLAARTLAPADYGIFREQITRIAGADSDIPTFEAAMAGRTPTGRDRFLVRLPERQSTPVVTASQVLQGQLAEGELRGAVAIVAEPSSLQGLLTTALSPEGQGTSEAEFRAHAIQALIDGRAVLPARAWESWLILAIFGVVLGLLYRRSDPKRLALIAPLILSVLALVGSWASLQFAGRLLPVTALFLAPWCVSFLRVLGRERRQDRRLEEAAGRAVQHAFGRSALREGARLPDFLSDAARLAMVEKSLLIEEKPDGSIIALNHHAASFDDIALQPRELSHHLSRLKDRHAVVPAQDLVPTWPGQPRVTWLGGTGRDLYWLYTLPKARDPRRSALLVRAIATSFRELFRWRSHLNARKRMDERFIPVDDKVASAIALVSQSSEQIRHGFDTVGTAVMIFHMIGSPLHANAAMQEIYRQAGLTVAETTVTEALLALTDLDAKRIDAMLRELLLNGGEMRVPMRSFGAEERMFRVAAPSRFVRGLERVIVLEAIDVSELHRAADLRQAVALFMDLQLRNDFEAIMLASELASDPRVTIEQTRPIVGRISETTRRAIGRLDEVADLVRQDIGQLADASYPVDARKVVLEAKERVSELAEELDVTIDAELPGASGFTIAEPAALGAMLRAILRVIIADTPQGDSVQLHLEELDGRTNIKVSGGFGIALERLLALLSHNEGEAVGDYRTISEGMARAVQWDAQVSYWGREADGFGFNINLRRIG